MNGLLLAYFLIYFFIMEDDFRYSKEEYYQFVKIQLDQNTDVLCLILKGQVIIEYTLNKYLLTIDSLRKANYSSEYFSFKQKIETTRDFSDLDDQEDNMTEVLFLLNEIRNDIINSLNFQKNKVVLFINHTLSGTNHKESIFRNIRINELVEAYCELASRIFMAGKNKLIEK